MLKKFIFAVAIVVLIGSAGLSALAVSSDFGLKEASQGTGLIKAGSSINSSEELPALIGRIVSLVLSFLGIIFFLLILYAGFQWMTAFGNTTKIDKAKEIMEAAGVGLIIILAAYAITVFVFNSLEVGGRAGTAQQSSGELMGPTEPEGLCCTGKGTQDTNRPSSFCFEQGWRWEETSCDTSETLGYCCDGVNKIAEKRTDEDCQILSIKAGKTYKFLEEPFTCDAVAP